MQNDDLSICFRNKPRMSALICRFNQQPTSYIASSHLAGFCDERLFKRLLISQRSRRRLSRWILYRHNIGSTVWGEFAEPRRRLALLTPDVLKRLVTYAGAMLASPSIAKVVDRSEQMKLKASLGEDVYFFAIKRAPFLAGGEAAVPLANSLHTDWSVFVRQLGCRCLEQCFSNEPMSLTSRLRFKFDADWPLTFSQKQTDEERESAWKLLRKLLVSELGEGGFPCFD